MNVTAEHAGGAVVLELDEGCRSVAALRRIISAALRHLKEDGFDVTVQGRAVEDVDVCGLEEGAKIQVVESRRAVALEALRAAGRDVSEDGLKNGMFMAIKRGDEELCERYLDAGCDVNALYGGNGRAPLHVAARNSLPDLCKLLLQRGADVNKRDDACNTPLHGCSHQISCAAREVLLSHGADMHAVGFRGTTPLDNARTVRKRYLRSRDREAAFYDTRDGRVGGFVRRRKPGSFSHKQPLPPHDAYDQFVKYGAPKMKKRWSNPCRKEYEGCIHKLAKVQFKERKQQITWKGMRIVNAFVTDVLERLGGEAGRVTSFSGAKTLSVRSVVAAVKLQLPEELATHALAAGTAAVGRYAKACGGRR